MAESKHEKGNVTSFMKYLLLLHCILASCQPVDVTDQVGLSRACFDFTPKSPRVMECGLTTQLERGRASTSNVNAGGCSACR
jgi:hypothetical protein